MRSMFFCFFLVLSSLYSCCDEELVKVTDNVAVGLPEECGAFLLERTEVYSPVLNDIPNELFQVLQVAPMFGDNDSDLEDYLFDDLELCDQDPIEDGEIIYQLVIYPNGKARTFAVFESRLRSGTFIPIFDKVESMPNWKPGSQQGEPQFVLVSLQINIVDGNFSLMQ